MNTVKSDEDIIKYRKFLYQDEYPDGNYPEDLIYPKPLTKEEIIKECNDANKFGFDYFIYCTHCHDSWLGGSGLKHTTNLLKCCSTCYSKDVVVYDTKTYEEL